MKAIKTFLGALAFLNVMFFSGCGVDPTPPTTIGGYEPTFTVLRTYTASGVGTSVINVYIRTGVALFTDIDDGTVKMNGQTLRLQYDLANLPYYDLPGATINTNTAYTLEIALDNGGGTGTCTVTTQEKVFTSLTAPATSNAQTDLPISWTEVTNHQEMTVSLLFTTSGSSVPTIGPSHTLTSAQMAAGAFTIPKASFSGTSGITSVLVTVRGVKKGTSSNFKSGSDAESVMTISKSVTFQ